MGFLRNLFGGGSPAPVLPVHPDDEELVTDGDRKWYATLSLDDCKSFEQQDQAAQMALFMKMIENDGLSKTEAARRVRKSHIFYYGTLSQRADEPMGFTGEDAKLPYVVKDRANSLLLKYVRKMDRKEIESSSSMNAIIRRLLRTEK